MEEVQCGKEQSLCVHLAWKDLLRAGCELQSCPQPPAPWMGWLTGVLLVTLGHETETSYPHTTGQQHSDSSEWRSNDTAQAKASCSLYRCIRNISIQ